MNRALFGLLLLATAVHADLSGVFVGIDPGHGGPDPGAVANGLQENTLNLQTAFALREFLEADGAKTVMSRETDISLTEEGSGRVELVTRARFFNSEDVDYMLSVHHNAFPANPNANGVLAYVARGNCNAPSKSGPLAAKTVQRVMASTEANAMQGANGSRCSGKEGVFEWGAVIVTETKMPAVLQEISFMTNLAEADKLADPDYVRRNGWAVYAGLVDFLGGEPKPYQAKDASAPQGQLAVLENGVQIEPGAFLDFGQVEIGQAQTRALHLTNTGDATLSWSAVLQDPKQGFTWSSADCVQLEPGDQCAAEITFSPQATGTLETELRFDPRDDPVETWFSVTVTGVGMETFSPPPVPTPMCQDQTCALGDGSADSCSESLIQQALEQGNVLELNCPGAVIRVRQPLVVDDKLTLRGKTADAAMPILDGGGENQLFIVRPDAELTLENLALHRGLADNTCGGAVQVLEQGTLTLRNTTLRGNQARGASQCGGGAVFVDLRGELRVENSLFADNQAVLGGALYFHGAALHVADSGWLANRAVDADSNPDQQGQGGAVYLHGGVLPEGEATGGQVLFERNAFAANHATRFGGALWTLGAFPARITNSVFNHNRAVSDETSDSGGQGGAIAGNGALACAHCTLLHNHAGFLGGAWYRPIPKDDTMAPIVLENSVIAYNTANNDGLGWRVAQHCEGSFEDSGGNFQFPGPNADPTSGDTACVATLTIADPLIATPTSDAPPSDSDLSTLRQLVTPELAANSPLIHAAKLELCAEVDFSGKNRVPHAGGDASACDSGAMEWREAVDDSEPKTGTGLALDLAKLVPAKTDSRFRPVLLANETTYASGANLAQTQTTTVAMDLFPQASDQTTPVNTVILAEYLPPGLDHGLWFVRDGPQWQVWNGDLFTLPAAEREQVLGQEYRLTIFQGPFANLPGTFTIFAGYLTQESMLIYNGGAWLRFTIR